LGIFLFSGNLDKHCFCGFFSYLKRGRVGEKSAKSKISLRIISLKALEKASFYGHKMSLNRPAVE